MASSTLIGDYIGYGLHSARPTTPPSAAGVAPIYYETDTTTAFQWNGSAWIAISVSSAALDATFGSSQGDILYRGSSAWTVLAPGTAGNVLTTHGGVNNPPWSTGGGGGGGGSPPTVRASTMITASNSTYTVTFPTGSVAGDMAFIWFVHGFSISSIPTGWNLIAQNPASVGNISAGLMGKVLSSGDISTGSVTLSFAGGFDGTISCLTFVGATSFFTNLVSTQLPATPSSLKLLMPGITDGAYGIYFMGVRGSGAVSSNQGTLLQQQNNGSSASGALYVGAPGNTPFESQVTYTATSSADSFWATAFQVSGP